MVCRWGGAGFDARRRFALALALAWGGLACGGEEVQTGRVASMLAPTAASEDAAVDQGPPVIESIVLEPVRPVAGGRVRAKARVRRAGGSKAEVIYQWQTSSGRALGVGQELDTKGLDPGTVVEVVATPEVDGKQGEPLAQRIRLGSEASQVALVVIDARDGKQVGAVLRAVVETTDEDAGFDAATFEWRVGGKPVGSEEELDTAPFQPGDVVELRARPSDELAEGSARSRPIHAGPIVLERSAAPEILSQPVAGIEGGLFRYALQATSAARGAQLRYELVKGPAGMTVDAGTGMVEWRPKSDQRGRFDVEVAALDQWGSGVVQSFEISADARVAPPASAR